MIYKQREVKSMQPIQHIIIFESTLKSGIMFY